MTDSPTPDETQEIANALASGHKIEAIKIYRSATGKGLKEAKEFIEALVPQLIEKDPERFMALSTPKGFGCVTVILAFLSIGAAATLFAIVIY
jgi:hypothetical protein